MKEIKKNKKDGILEIKISILEDDYENWHRKVYYIDFNLVGLIYMADLVNYSDVVNKYCFKQKTCESLDELIEEIKAAYEYVMDNANQYYKRIDLVFERHDIAHVSREYRYESNSRIILQDNGCSYNRELDFNERQELYNRVKKEVFNK